MTTGRRWGAGLAIVATLGLAGCATGGSSDIDGRYPDASLRDTKASAQLLRNEVASRIPADLVKDVGETLDESEPCLTAKEDPGETIRSWKSTATIELQDASAASVDSLIDMVAASFTDQGWKLASLGGSPVIHTRYLSNDSSSAIDISAISADPDALYLPSSELETASVVIIVHGPCVRTQGAGSEEVSSLE